MIRLNHADKYYNRGGSNELHVMNDISLELPETGMIAVFGPSGCGKTTLLNAIGGLDKLTSGEITVFGDDISKNTDYIRNKYIGYIFQNYNLSKNETVAENVADALKLCGMSDEKEISERVNAALVNVGMEKFKNRQPDTLSGGQQQRVAIARALVKNPSVILADEPTGNLDENNTIMVMDILKQVSRDHLVLLVTHEANLVDYYCDRVIGIVDGKVDSVRDNENANGYTARNKNDIYLGELEKRESKIPGVRIEYYGTPDEEIKLRIVTVEGKTYLKSDSPQLKILDDSSELKLREGAFEDIGKKAKEAVGEIDMSHLKPFEGKRFGKLFSFRSALVSGYRENFPKKKKKGRLLLRISMFLLACVVVFMSANFAVGIKALNELKGDHNENLFYLPLTEDTDTSAVSRHIGEYGLDYARVIGSDYTNGGEEISFRVGNFITAAATNLSATGSVLDARLAENLPLVCGSKTFENPLDVVVSTALADDLIASTTVSFVENYNDLLNMISTQKYDGENYMRIVGVVKSTEKAYYLQSLYASNVILKNIYGNSLNITPASFDKDYKDKVTAGTVVVTTTDNGVSKGDSIKIMGKDYRVAMAKRVYDGIYFYEDYVAEVHKIALDDADTYAQKHAADGAEWRQLQYEWFFDYYTQYLREYGEFVYRLDFEPWDYVKYGDIEMLISFASQLRPIYMSDMVELYAGYLYKQENGAYPTEQEYYEYLYPTDEETGEQIVDRYSIISDRYYSKIQELYNRRMQEYNDYTNQSMMYSPQTSIIMNDADYITLAYATGENNPYVCSRDLFESYLSYDGTIYYAHYLLIHANNAKEASGYLTGVYGDGLITPDEVYDKAFDDMRPTIVGNSVSLAVVLVLICLCIFFIMRSSLMSRVKEIGVYRAIGVSKKNLTFRFMVESLVLTTLSLTVGYILSAAIIMKLSAFQLISSMFFFPFWLAALLLVGLYAVAVLFGTLPVRMMLRKTPSEILSKYDI